jgi:RNA polymerase sigma factor (sigma-70 family)
VKGIPGTLQGGGASFATTHWSVVGACRSGSGETEKAVAQLCRDYWPPLYSFVRRRGYSPADAQDLVQGFFTHLLHHRIYEETDRAKGKFRTFLLAALKNYIADHRDKENTLKRGGRFDFVFLDSEIDTAERLYENATEMILDEERHYEQRWAAALVSRAIEGLQGDFLEGSKAEIFARLKPFVCGGEGLPKQEDVAQQLSMPIDTLRSHLSRMRARYRSLLREEVARTIGIADDVDEELRYLSQILIAAS